MVVIFSHTFFYLFFVIGVVIIGEGINAITTKVAHLSPITKQSWVKQWKETIEFAFNKTPLKVYLKGPNGQYG